MLDLISKVVQKLTGNKNDIDNELMETLYASLLLSNIDEPLDSQDLKKGVSGQDEMVSSSQRGLFADYQDQYILMNVNSPIAKEVADIQTVTNNHRSNMFLLKLLSDKVQSKFYQQASLAKHIAAEMKNFRNNGSEEKHTNSFFIDLEA